MEMASQRVRECNTRTVCLGCGVVVVVFAALALLAVVFLREVLRLPTPVSEREVIGTYTFRWEDGGRYVGTEVLVLRNDHTFSQTFRGSRGRALRDQGEWHLDTPVRLRLECLHDWIREASGPRIAPGGAIWVLTIEKLRSGGIEITIDDDKGWCYTKPPADGSGTTPK